MIAYLKGRVLAMTAETAIIEVGGVGYELYCSGSAFRKMSAGEIVEVYTYLQVKEDGVTLFGFSTPQEKDLFLKSPVSIISGDSSKETIDKAFTYGIVDMIEKPFNGEDIKKVIEKCIYYRNMNNN